MIRWQLCQRIIKRFIDGVRMGAMTKQPRALSILLLLFLLVSSCSFRPPVTPVVSTSISTADYNSISADVSPTPLFPTPLSPGSLTPTPPAPTLTTDPAIQNTQYQLAATLDYAQHQLSVDERIHYTNNSPDRLDHLLLDIEPAHYPGSFNLQSLTWEDGQEVEGTTWEVQRLRLPLREPLDTGKEVSLSLRYQLNLPSPQPSALTRPEPFGYTARQTNLVDWYPFIPPYQSGIGWLAHDPGFFGEHQVYNIADFQVEIRLAEPGFAGQPLIIAASAPVQQKGEVYRYQVSSVRNFTWSVSHEYQVTSQSAGSVTVYAYTFPYHAQAGQAVLQTTVQALELYGRLFGPYQQRTLSVVEADFLDGMEYDGLFFLSNGFYNLYQGTPAEYLVAIAAHETAHQWWYGLVGNDQALEPWLDEALCTYSERIFFENVYPSALDWWWAYRVNYYEPHGWVDGSIYNPEGYRAYRSAVYLNGAIFLEELRGQVGENAFFATLRDYAAIYSHNIATGKNFFDVLAAHTSVYTDELVKQYFQNPPE